MISISNSEVLPDRDLVRVSEKLLTSLTNSIILFNFTGQASQIESS